MRFLPLLLLFAMPLMLSAQSDKDVVQLFNGQDLEGWTQVGWDKFAVVDVTGYTAAGQPRFEDMQVRLKERLASDLALRHFVSQLRRKAYVDIRY